MKWTSEEPDSDTMMFTATIMLDGQPSENSALLKRVE
jgi:hypothetical protein